MKADRDWLPVTTACPACGTRNAVRVRQVLRVNAPGTYSLAGAQDKVTARPGWEYECRKCGDHGAAEPED